MISYDHKPLLQQKLNLYLLSCTCIQEKVQSFLPLPKSYPYNIVCYTIQYLSTVLFMYEATVRANNEDNTYWENIKCGANQTVLGGLHMTELLIMYLPQS